MVHSRDYEREVVFKMEDPLVSSVSCSREHVKNEDKID